MGLHQRWRMRQPALLSMLRSSAQGQLRLLSAIKARNCRPISTHVHENCPNLFVLNLKYFKIICGNVWMFGIFVYLCSKLEKFKIRTEIGTKV